MFMRVINTGSQPGNCYALKSESSEILLLDCGCRYSEILKGLDLPKPETPIEAFSREAQRQLDRIVSKSLEEMRVTEESDVDLDEEFEHGSIYISLPSGVSDATIQRVLREFHNAPEFSKCEITINVEGGR